MPGGYKPSQADNDLISEVREKYEECLGSHGAFVDRYEKNERAYEGILRPSSDAAAWKHQVHPRYGLELVETVIANTVEMGLRMKCTPSPHAQVTLPEAQQLLAQAQTVEYLLRHEHRADKFDFKQRPLYLTAAIGGRGILKGGWNFVERTVRRQGVTDVPVYDDQENYIGSTPQITTIEHDQVFRDHSTTEVVDPRDFIVHPSTKSLNPYDAGGAQHLFHRQWYSMEQLRMLEASGFFKNVEYLADAKSYSNEYDTRDSRVFNLDPQKDLLEVLEYWCFKNGELNRSYIGNRAVVLRGEEKDPFWHGGYPFVVCSTMPQPFSITGISEVELIAELQEIMWELMNQRLDNIELINNAIYLIRSDFEDPDSLIAHPGAKWMVESPDQVEMLTPPYQLAQISMEAEALLKGDLQNVTAAAPFAGGADSATVDQKTATGASIVMGAAQARLSFKKFTIQQGLVEEAEQRIKNCQQFIDPNYLVHAVGKDGAPFFFGLNPLDIQGDFIFELEPMGESTMRQEKRAEATQFFQTALAAAPAMAVTQSPINLAELFRWYADHWDIPDAERFLSASPAALGAASLPGQPGGAGGDPGAEQGPNLGITSGAAIDASSPSAAGGISGSPVTALQRAGALSSGAQNQ